MIRIFIVLFTATLVRAQTAEEIMAKVAENQSRTDAARTAFVYHQNLLVRMKRGNGKLAREEDREYIVTPQPDGTKREMVKFTGKYGAHGKEVAIAKPGEEYKGLDIDAGVVKGLADDFGNDSKSRDGIGNGMFPLSAKKQALYQFTLQGMEKYRERDVYRITFTPRKRSPADPASARDDGDDNDECWAGEALIDAMEMQPVLITTHLAVGVPLVVRAMLGTNIQQVGFKLTYRKVDGNLWFPATYSGEFKVRALFLYSRTISMGAINSDFRKADVQSTLTFDRPADVKIPDR